MRHVYGRGSRRAIEKSIQYANERHQFNQPIGNFGAIKYKLAEQTIRNFAVESALYRTSQLLQEKKQNLMDEGMDVAMASMKAAEE
ncbi:MAG: acyl-CoA dehydrogenase family protein [Saprospiraceae bacterium]